VILSDWENIWNGILWKHALSEMFPGGGPGGVGYGLSLQFLSGGLS
jgi:hypothetical protein